MDARQLPAPATTDPNAVLELLESRDVRYTTWQGWLALDAHERALGEADESDIVRERVKVVPRDEQVDVSRVDALAAP